MREVFQKTFDKIYCINLDVRPDRWEFCQKEFERYNILDLVERLPAFHLPDVPEAGCTTSHMQCIRNAKKHNYKNVFIDTKKMLGDWAQNAKIIKINSLEYKKNYDIMPNFPQLEDKLIVTLGKNGCKYKDKLFSTEEVPVKDVSGAGDTFLAALVVEYLKTNDIERAINFAQDCTTKVVQKHGVATI